MPLVELSTILGSASAGFLSRIICHPFDTCKAQVQALQHPDRIINVCKNIIQKEGFSGLYRGVGAASLGGIPGVGLYLTSYEMAKQNFGKFSSSKFLTYFFSGMFAEAVSCVVFVPVDVVKERLQVQMVQRKLSPQITSYRNSFDAFRTIIAKEGWVNGIYKGYGITLLSFGPFSALYFVLYEEIKAKYQKNPLSLKMDEILGKSRALFVSSLCISAFAGSFASIITNPLDLIKLRIQVNRRLGNDGNANTVFTTFQNTYQLEGVRGLFRGSLARVLFHAPNTALTMGFYEYCYGWWKELLE